VTEAFKCYCLLIYLLVRKFLIIQFLDIGGGIINSKILLSVLLFLGLALVMNFGSVSATNSSNVAVHTNTSTTTVLKTSSISTSTKTLTSTNVKKTVAVNMYGLSNAQILNGFKRAQNFYFTKNRLPNYVSYGTKKVPISKFNLILAAKGLKIVPTANIWAKVKNVAYDQQDTSYTCGPSSLKMDFSNYGMNLNEMGLASYAGTNSNIGTTESGLISAVKKVNVKYGTHFKAWDASFASVGWTGLYSSIAHNNPVIIHIRSFLNPNGGHYVLLTGMNLYLKQVKIADPSFGGYRILSFSALLTRVNWVVSTGRSSTPLVFLTKT